MESYSQWETVPAVVAPFGDIILHTDRAAFTVLLRSSGLGQGPSRDLLVQCGENVIACMSHDEFAHPWNGSDEIRQVPKLEGEWARFAYPLLKVKDSEWLATFSSSQILDDQRSATTHLRFVSLDNTVDLLFVGKASAEWVATFAL